MLEKSDTRVKGALFIRDLVIHGAFSSVSCRAARVNIRSEDLRGGIIRAGAIMGFFNMLNSSNTKVHIAAMGHIRYMIRYGMSFWLAIIKTDKLMPFQMIYEQQSYK